MGERKSGVGHVNGLTGSFFAFRSSLSDLPLRQGYRRRSRRRLLAGRVFGPDFEVDEVPTVFGAFGGDYALAGDVLVDHVHAAVLAGDALDAAFVANPFVEHAAEEGVLERAMGDP